MYDLWYIPCVVSHPVATWDRWIWVRDWVYSTMYTLWACHGMPITQNRFQPHRKRALVADCEEVAKSHLWVGCCQVWSWVRCVASVRLHQSCKFFGICRPNYRIKVSGVLAGVAFVESSEQRRSIRVRLRAPHTEVSRANGSMSRGADAVVSDNGQREKQNYDSACGASQSPEKQAKGDAKKPTKPSGPRPHSYPRIINPSSRFGTGWAGVQTFQLDAYGLYAWHKQHGSICGNPPRQC